MPPPRPSVMLRYPAGKSSWLPQRGYFTVSGTICWPQSYPGTISEMRIRSQNRKHHILYAKTNHANDEYINYLKKHSDDLTFRLV